MTTTPARAATEGAPAMPSSARPAPRRAPARTARKPIRSPSGPANGARRAPARTATPVTGPIAEARFGRPAWRLCTSRGRYGRLIWLARMETPKIRKIRRTAGPEKTPVIAAAPTPRAPPGRIRRTGVPRGPPHRSRGGPAVARADEQEGDHGEREDRRQPEDVGQW